eukprot:3941271-Rhodomonas_salina.4
MQCGLRAWAVCASAAGGVLYWPTLCGSRMPCAVLMRVLHTVCRIDAALREAMMLQFTKAMRPPYARMRCNVLMQALRVLYTVCNTEAACYSTRCATLRQPATAHGVQY